MIEIHKKSRKLDFYISPRSVDSSKSYRRSQFVYPFERDGRTYLFNTFTKQCFDTDGFILSDALYSADEVAVSDELSELVENSFLVPSDRDECAYYEGIIRMLRISSRKKGFKKYTILPTTGCNARCVYCFEEGMKQVLMTEESARKTARYIAETRIPDKSIHIEWFGGEPLLGAKYIDIICKGLADRGISFTGSMVTNGSLLTDEIVDKMTALWNIRHLQVSVDGTEQEYIKRKQYPNYTGQYQRVMEGIHRATAKGINVNIRCNVDDGNLGDIDGFIDVLDREFPERKNISAYFVPMNEVRASDRCLRTWQRCYAAADELKRRGFLLGEENHVLSLRVHNCIADDVTGSVVIAPDGSLYRCEGYDEEDSYGDIDNGVTDESNLKRFADYGKTREKCRDCVFLPECTSFSKCMITDLHCQEVREIIQNRAMDRMLADSKTKGEH